MFYRKLTAEFLSALEAEGRPAGPASLMAVERILAALPEGASPDELRLALVPLLAGSPQEQARLYELFGQALARTEALLGEQTTPETAPLAPDPLLQRWKRRMLIPALALLLAGAFGLYLYLKPPPTVAALPIQEPTDTTTGDLPSTEQALFQTKPYPYFHDLAPLEIKPPPDFQVWMAKHWHWARWVLAFFFTLFGLALWRYLAYKRRKLVAEQQRREKPPYAWNVVIPGAEQIELGDQYRYALQSMRRRAALELLHLDVPRSVAATAEHGGMPQFRFRQRSSPVDYLLLIDRQSAQNHRARLFDALYRAFRDQEVEIARYWYDSDLRVCFNEENPYGTGLETLRQRYHDARLLVVGTGVQLLSPHSGKPQTWTSLLAQWKHRLLLSPRPLLDWSRDEQQLAEILHVLPATLSALSFWMDEIDAGQDARFEGWRERIEDAPLAPIHPPENDPIPLLETAYGPALLRWIAACAVFPTLHWDLTLWIGQYLEGSGATQNSKPETQNLSYAKLQHLFRLPWFVQGEIPPPARAALLQWLQAEDPQLLATLRRELVDVLAQNPPPEDSAAWDEYRMNLALQDWLSTADPARKKQLEQEIARLLAAGQEADFTVIKALRKPQNPLDFVVPEAWKKYLHPGGFAALGWQGEWKALRWLLPLWLLGLTALFWPRTFHTDTGCTGEPVEYRPPAPDLARTLCLDSALDSLLYFEYRSRDAIGAGRLEQVDSLERGYMPDVRRLDSVALRETRANLATALYNKGVAFYEAQRKDSACVCFQLMVEMDGATGIDLDFERAIAWCKGTTDNPPVAQTLRSGLEMVPVRGGRFTMGCQDGRDADCYDSEKPAHEVTLPDFSIGKYEVTQADWRKIMGSDPSELGFKGCDQCPVERVSWNDVQVFLKKLNAQTGRAYRLPTEAEWEYAARGGNQSKGYPYSGSNNLDKVAWYDGNAAKKTHPVGEKAPNELGLYDLSGNAWEWVKDGWHSDYKGAPATGQAWMGQSQGNNQVYRGGGWNGSPRGCRISYRNNGAANLRDYTIGFRLALDLRSDKGAVKTGPGTTPTAIATPIDSLAVTEPSLRSGLTMVRVAGGRFTMGCKDGRDADCSDYEKPAHEVTLRDFSIGKYEVTQADWRKVMGKDPPQLYFKGCDQCPVESVSWDDIQDFLKKLNAQTGRRYRLPTEAEWEYAARGGAQSKGYLYSGGNELDKVAWYYSNSNSKTHPVGETAANELGLYDMSGNVYEWCGDWYGDYSVEAQSNPQGPNTGEYPVARGGGWARSPHLCRAAYRSYYSPSNRYYDLGFRLVLQ